MLHIKIKHQVALFLLMIIIISMIAGVSYADNTEEKSFEVLARIGEKVAEEKEPAAYRVLLSVTINDEHIHQVQCYAIKHAVQNAEVPNKMFFDYFVQIPLKDTFELLTFVAVDKDGRYITSQQLLIQITDEQAIMRWLTE